MAPRFIRGLALSVGLLCPLGAAAAGAPRGGHGSAGDRDGQPWLVERAAAQRGILAELAALLGHGVNERRLQEFEELLRPMYMALPKDTYGLLDQGTARYVLHRFFLQNNAWHVEGLTTVAGKQEGAKTSTAMVLKSMVPAVIFETLEDKLGRSSVGLRELAALAATVEDVVHGDAIELLKMAYNTHSFSIHEPIADASAEELIVKTYMIYAIMPWTQAAANNSERIKAFLPAAHESYPGWNATVVWLNGVKETVRSQESDSQGPLAERDAHFRDFASMSRLVREISNGFGHFQDTECNEIKRTLLELEDRKDGRVLLANFYGSRLAGTGVHFSESPGYLQHLGALDLRDPARPSVIVPNLIYSRSNCMATSSGFHSICCINRCHLLLGALERHIVSPSAPASLVAQLVAAMPSDTFATPRNLSELLRRKLDEIAEQHAGKVPLHSKMFARWMHFAFPNECPYLRQSGEGQAPLGPSKWAERWNLTTPIASREVMQSFVDLANRTCNDTAGKVDVDELTAPWLEIEDGSGEEAGTAAGDRRPWARKMRLAVMTAVVAATLGSLAESLRLGTHLWQTYGGAGTKDDGPAAQPASPSEPPSWLLDVVQASGEGMAAEGEAS